MPMAELDNPLKVLITEFSIPFAAWLLGVPVQSVRLLNVEFPGTPLRSDLFFEVIDKQGRKLLLHIELQGRRSHKPMPFRQLEYMVQIAIRELTLPLGVASPRLHSVVIYTGGAGQDDDGHYTVYGLGETASLSWQYQVIRLWEMKAADLMGLGEVEPALLALLGQTQLEQPEVVLPQAIQRIRQVSDKLEKGRILTALVSLLRGDEVITMVEKLLELEDDVLLNTPYLRRIRRQGWEEGVQIGRQEGVQEGMQLGRQEGRQLGRQEGVVVGQEIGLRQAILEASLRKFNPSAIAYRQLGQWLEQIHQPLALQRVLLALLDVAEMEGLLAVVEREVTGETAV